MVIRIPVIMALVELITSEIKDIYFCEKVLLDYNGKSFRNPEVPSDGCFTVSGGVTLKHLEHFEKRTIDYKRLPHNALKRGESRFWLNFVSPIIFCGAFRAGSSLFDRLTETQMKRI